MAAAVNVLVLLAIRNGCAGVSPPDPDATATSTLSSGARTASAIPGTPGDPANASSTNVCHGPGDAEAADTSAVIDDGVAASSSLEQADSVSRPPASQRGHDLRRLITMRTILASGR